MSVFTSAPFNLVHDQLIVARIRAINSYGNSDWSDLNTKGELIKSVPFQMPQMETIYTITTQLQITFPEGFLPNSLNGGFEIDFIYLYSDDGQGGAMAKIQ